MKALRSLFTQQPEHVQVTLSLDKEWRVVFDHAQDKHVPRQEDILSIHLHNLGDAVVNLALVEVLINGRRVAAKTNIRGNLPLLPPDGELSFPYPIPGLLQGKRPHRPVVRAVVHTARRGTFKSPPLALPDTVIERN